MGSVCIAQPSSQVIAREIFNPNFSLFVPVPMGGSTFQPNPNSVVQNDEARGTNHLDFFKFVGRCVGKALHDGHLIDAYFTRSFYKHMLAQPLTYQVRSYKHMLWKRMKALSLCREESLMYLIAPYGASSHEPPHGVIFPDLQSCQAVSSLWHLFAILHYARPMHPISSQLAMCHVTASLSCILNTNDELCGFCAGIAACIIRRESVRASGLKLPETWAMAAGH